ncbi:hypothetical protein QQ008_15515 [Fulvivirgaceae bacterium BMA10]|uniref:CPBP family intramembrane metalloprotease n=1 Tax=Splendidivirga corallicola TaxID=3051826 RepID=A0ABT8KPX1_9BACT|nr:hypothetical protein [Fulvivirgaceae bacterium BMA10]
MNYRKFEIIAVLLTGLLKFLVVDYLDAKFWFILTTGTFWLVYMTVRIYRKPEVLNEWGIGVAGFRKTLQLLFIPALVITLGFVWLGLRGNTLLFNWHIIPVMFLYPLWGFIQQLLIIALFGGNIHYLEDIKLSKLSIVGLTSILFSVVHFPSIPLMVATFFLAVSYCFVFLRFRNVLVLGIFHGWLACFFYFFVLGRDPWLEFIGSI